MDVPATASGVDEKAEAAIQIEIVGRPFNDQRLVALRGVLVNEPSHPSDYHPTATTGSEQSNAPFVSSTAHVDQAHADYWPDISQHALDFILTLEKLCLYHHKCSSPELLELQASGSGHELMLSSPILNHAPTSFSHAHSNGYADGLQWNTPAASLEHLFALSQQLQVDGGEITPIQMWQKLRRHSRFEDLDAADLGRLTTQLLPKVECRG